MMVLVVAVARPATAAEDDVEQARAHARKATAAYNLGHYTESAREYEAAYEGSLDPNMLFNVGQAWRMAGERQKALTAYRSYLRTAAKGEQRSMAEAKIKELEEQASAPSAAVPAATIPSVATPPAPATTPAPTRPSLRVPELPSATTAAPSEVTHAERSAGAGAEPPPFYTRWPFWAGVGAVVAAGVVTGIVLASGKGDLAMPPTTYGTKQY